MRLIELSRGKQAIVDDHMYEHLAQWTWYAQKAKDDLWYAKTHFRKKDGKFSTATMHQVICGQSLKRLMIDHINGNGLDNRKENLRHVSRRENAQNGHKHRAGKLPGAFYKKAQKKWDSVIVINSKKVYLGRFDSDVMAHKVYKAACTVIRRLEEPVK